MRYVINEWPLNITSAARFGNLYVFQLLNEPFGDQYFALLTLKFGYILGKFEKIVKKPV